MQRVLAQPDVKERLLGVGVDVVGSTPEELARFQRAELDEVGEDRQGFGRQG